MSHALGFCRWCGQDRRSFSDGCRDATTCYCLDPCGLAAVGRTGAEDVSLAYPNVAFTFSAAYIAEDVGLFAKHGLRLKPLLVAGPGSTNAVISGSADFALASTTVQTRAAARGQRLLSIVNPTDRPIVQIILRKEFAANVDPKAPLADRIK